MRKLKIYLDTSIISHLDQQDAPEKMADTLALWEEIKKGLHEIYISDVVLREMQANAEPKQTILAKYLAEIKYNLIPISDEIDVYADMLIQEGILTAKSRDDCFHIASAVVGGCNIILSWNFKHILRVKTVDGVKIVSTRLGYNEVRIFTPSSIIETEEER